MGRRPAGLSAARPFRTPPRQARTRCACHGTSPPCMQRSARTRSEQLPPPLPLSHLSGVCCGIRGHHEAGCGQVVGPGRTSLRGRRRRARSRRSGLPRPALPLP
eukprot:scaffold106626_cov22-Tisochrysis_lutea.AAC.1